MNKLQGSSILATKLHFNRKKNVHLDNNAPYRTPRKVFNAIGRRRLSCLALSAYGRNASAEIKG